MNFPYTLGDSGGLDCFLKDKITGFEDGTRLLMTSVDKGYSMLGILGIV
jgi:hypothetical protein